MACSSLKTLQEIWSKKTQTDIDAIDVKNGDMDYQRGSWTKGLEPIEEKDQQDFTDVEDFTIDDPTKISEEKNFPSLSMAK